MKKAIGLFAAGVCAIGLCAVRSVAQSKSTGAFDQLRILRGKWQATSSEGEKFTTSVRPVSNGTALEETFNNSKAVQMVTLYTPDGARVALTHYCSMGNQPRMETPALAPSSRQFDFSFVGATNLARLDDPHMHHLLLKIVDQDHFTEIWTYSAGGRQSSTTFQFVRLKP